MATTSTTAAAATRRDEQSGLSNNAPTAKFLQARIHTLRNTLVSRLENIFAAAIDDLPAANASTDSDNKDGNTGDGFPAPPLTDTATRELQIDVESTALIRAAEEIMVLTRTMKELWLFGGLDTIVSNGEGSQEEENNKKMQRDEQEVVKGLMEFLQRMDHRRHSDDADSRTEIEGER